MSYNQAASGSASGQRAAQLNAQSFQANPQRQKSAEEEYEEFMNINQYILYIEDTVYQLAVDQMQYSADSLVYAEYDDNIRALDERLVYLKASRDNFRFSSVIHEAEGENANAN